MEMQREGGHSYVSLSYFQILPMFLVFLVLIVVLLFLQSLAFFYIILKL